MKQLSVFEHEWLEIGTAAGARLTEQQGAALERLAPALPAGALEWRRYEVKFAQFCGVIQLDGLVIEVLPKLGRQSEQADRSRGLLLRMLQTAGLFRPTPVGSASMGRQSFHLLDWFIDHFRAQVQEQLRMGAIRRYVERNDSLTHVRGRLDFNTQLRENLTRPQLIACQFEELEQDNIYNQSLVNVLGQLRHRAQHPQVVRDITELLLHFGAISACSIVAEDVEKLRFNRMEDRWLPVFQQATLFLRNLHPDVSAGESSALALLFNMNMLFERFVAATLREAMPDWELSTLGQARHLARDTQGRTAFTLKPDIMLSRNANPMFIADAKWKLLDPARRQSGISRADIYQMLAYAERYACEDIALIYPAVSGSGGIDAIEEYRVEGSSVVIHILGIDLKFAEGLYSEYSTDPIGKVLTDRLNH